MDSFEGSGPQEMRTALCTATKHRTLLFVSDTAFELLVRWQIHRFLRPSLTFVDMVSDKLKRMAETVESSEPAPFHHLHVSVLEETLRLLGKKSSRDRNGDQLCQQTTPKFCRWQASDWRLVFGSCRRTPERCS